MVTNINRAVHIELSLTNEKKHSMTDFGWQGPVHSDNVRVRLKYVFNGRLPDPLLSVGVLFYEEKIRRALCISTLTS